MLTKITRRDCLDRYKAFPLRKYDYEKDEEEYFYPDLYRSHILTLRSKSFKGHVRLLGMELTKLAARLGYEILIFMGDAETAWLYQDNDHKAVQEARQYLVGHMVGKRFNGGIQVDIQELPVFVRHLSWLTRSNAALPYVHFIDSGQNIVGNICKYGNLHLDALNEEANGLLTAFVGESQFEYLDGLNCHNQFGKTSSISGGSS